MDCEVSASFSSLKSQSFARLPTSKATTEAVVKETIGMAGGIVAASFVLALSAGAATVKLGSDAGALVFVPDTLTIKTGETVEFVNNVGFPHNVVFDEDNIPDGVNAESLSHEDYLNAPGETVTTKFEKPGSYGYYCEPHRGAGMLGKIVVQ